MDFTLEEARIVAGIDYEVGILSAIEKLEKYGYNCDSYYKEIGESDLIDFDRDNIHARDNLYKKLGIYELMEQAYKELWK